MKVVIVGDGYDACVAALAFAEAKHSVLLVTDRKREELCKDIDPSIPTPLGTGFDVHKQSAAAKQLQASIKLARRFQGSSSGEGDSFAGQRMHYFMRPEQDLRRYGSVQEQLRITYDKIVSEGELPPIFDQSDSFRYVSVGGYLRDTDPSQQWVVAAAAHPFVVWDNFRSALLAEIETNANIKVLTEKMVTDIEFQDENQKFQLTLTGASSEYTIEADFVTQATATNIRVLDTSTRKIKRVTPAPPRILVEIELDAKTSQRTDLHALCVLPNIAFYLLGKNSNGRVRALIACGDQKVEIKEKTTLVSELETKILADQASVREKKLYGNARIEQVSKYFPFVKSSKFVDFKFDHSKPPSVYFENADTALKTIQMQYNNRHSRRYAGRAHITVRPLYEHKVVDSPVKTRKAQADAGIKIRDLLRPQAPAVAGKKLQPPVPVQRNLFKSK